jgi:integrase
MSFHDVRHTYASLLVAANVHPVAELLGQRSVSSSGDVFDDLYWLVAAVEVVTR